MSTSSTAAPASTLAGGAQTQAKELSQRSLALDSYRGLIMILLVSGGFGFSRLPDKPLYRILAHQFEHKPWGGAVFYDLIMPAFLFMAGVSMAYSLGRRIEEGHGFRELLRHVAGRSIKLIAISQILLSIEAGRAHFQFHNVLTQVAATYFLCFLLMWLPFRLQALAAGLLLAGHSALYLLFPGPDGAFQQVTNIGAVIDRALMGRNYPWPCVNINFLSETPGVLFGLWTGMVLRGGRPFGAKVRILSLGMAAAFVCGLALSPVVPINKWLWTASYTLYTTGWSLLGLLTFYVLVEMVGLRRVMFPLKVVGMNSLFVYCAGEVLRGWMDRSVRVFTGGFSFAGELAPVFQACAVLGLMWYLAYWLFQRGLFLKA